jgi:hypothetical protein
MQSTRWLAHDLSVPLLATASARPIDRGLCDGPIGVLTAENLVIEIADATMLLDRPSSIGRDFSSIDVHLVRNRFGPTGVVRLAMHSSVPLVRNAARPPDEAAPVEDTNSRIQSTDLNGPMPR